MATVTAGLPFSLPDPDSVEYFAQKQVLLELVVTPPPWGDRVAYLLDYLPVPRDAIEPAIAALGAAGLAERRSNLVRGTSAVRYFEYLWPVRL